MKQMAEGAAYVARPPLSGKRNQAGPDFPTEASQSRPRLAHAMPKRVAA